MTKDVFSQRHIGPSAADVATMLETIGVSSLDALIDQTIPASIRLQGPVNVPKGVSEYRYRQHIEVLAAQNKVFRSVAHTISSFNCTQVNDKRSQVIAARNRNALFCHRLYNH